jgi:hypothetical protein
MDYPLRYVEKNEQAAGEKSMTWSVQVIKWGVCSDRGERERGIYESARFL